MSDHKQTFWVELGNCTEIIPIESTPARLYIMIAYVQLGLRFAPDGASADIAREMVANLTEAICHYVPEARESIEMGSNPDCDVTDNYFNAEFR
jgi:hypothetical protein